MPEQTKGFVNIFKKFGIKFFGYVLILGGMLFMAIYFKFVNKVINWPTFFMVIIGCIAFVYININDRKKDMIIEEQQTLNKAEEEVQKGQWNNAITLYDKVLVYDPKSMKAMMGRAYCLKEKAEYAEAIEQYDKVIEVKGGFYTIHFLQGVCFMRNRQFKKAAKALKKAISMKPDFIEPYIVLGDLYYMMNKMDKARMYYEEYMQVCDNEMMMGFAREKLASLDRRLERDQMMKEREEAIARGEHVEAIEESSQMEMIDSTRILDVMVNQMAKVEKIEDYKATRITKDDILKALKEGMNEKEKEEIFKILKTEVGVEEARKVVYEDEKISRVERDAVLKLMQGEMDEDEVDEKIKEEEARKSEDTQVDEKKVEMMNPDDVHSDKVEEVKEEKKEDKGTIEKPKPDVMETAKEEDKAETAESGEEAKEEQKADIKEEESKQA